MSLPCSVRRIWIFLLLSGCLALPLFTHAQTPTSPSVFVALPGSVHPLATPAADRGAVNASEPTGRILLLLKRPADREAALQQFLEDVNTPGNPTYHQWLTPTGFGQRFGPSDDDIQTLDAWLTSSGLSITHHSRSRSFVEFNGTVGQLNRAFHTEIHHYQVNGAAHLANATPLQIPQSLAGIVQSVAPLNDFAPVSYLRGSRSAHYDAASRKLLPNDTSSNAAGPLYTVTPADFATQYDLGPLTQAGVTGTGATIGIINVSNIDTALSDAFRSNFGLAAKSVQVIVDGSDPGVNSAATEAYLDVERAAGTAPGATVNLYIAGTNELQDALLLAAQRAVEDNTADILSVSFGEDEEQLGVAGNALWNAVWEQAAAQGQTVVVASGDQGSSGDYYFGMQTNGLATTPWDMAVGGTDFYYSDYATGAASAAGLWNATNDPMTKGSLKAPLPEQVWNDLLGYDAIPLLNRYDDFSAGGGGASSCVAVPTSTLSCSQGYPKPAWQSGPGVPADGVRDIPDVSLFAADGDNYSYYAVCAEYGDCNPDASGSFPVTLVGGTSASTPSMAGIMALIEQKYGRQGQASPTLYALAQQKPSVFHDVTLGSNETFCSQGFPSCVLNATYDSYLATVYAATPNYDLASGLGSFDASALVNNWNAISYKTTSTMLNLSSTSATHGQPITLSTTVTPQSGTGTPTGAVSLLASQPLSPSQGEGVITLSGGTGTTSLSSLPGGMYQLSGHYSGDGTFAPSTSTPVSLTISPESSQVLLTLTPHQSNGQYFYGNTQSLTAQVVNATGAADGGATGSIAFILDGATTMLPLGVSGTANYSSVLAVGNHTATAAFAGDASFKASTSQPLAFTVLKGSPFVNPDYSTPYGAVLPTIPVGESLYVATTVSAASNAPIGTVAPTGTLTVRLYTNFIGCGTNYGTVAFSQTVPLTTAVGQYSTYAGAVAVFPNLTAGYYYVCATYNGDANWSSASTIVTNGITVTGNPPLASTTTLSISPSTLSGGQLATVTATVNGLPATGPAPTGYISFYDNGVSLDYCYPQPTKGAQASCTFAMGVLSLVTNGNNAVTAVYTGDQNYQPSASAVVNVQTTQTPDFTLTPLSSSVTVGEGTSGSVGIALASVGNLSSTVNLTCTSSSVNVTCGFSPASVTLNGTATATLTVNASATLAKTTLHPDPSRGPWRYAPGGISLAMLFLLLNPKARKLRGKSLLGALLVGTLSLATGCGSSSSGVTPPYTPVTTTAATYTVSVTGNAAGLAHSAQIAVVVTMTK